MSPTLTRVVIPHYHNFIEFLGYNAGKHEFIQQLAAFLGGNDNACQAQTSTQPVLLVTRVLPPF